MPMLRRRLFNLIESVRTGYWFVPAVMALGSFGLAYAMLAVDASPSWSLPSALGLPDERSAEGARALLGAIAGSVITVAGTVFSITIVALTLASQQFGPRLLRKFMTDRGNQVVLGTFTATFLYCLLVLANIAGNGDDAAVPRLAVVVGFLLGIADLGVLIYFIHHVATSIQANRIIAGVALELERELDNLFPQDLGAPPPGPPPRLPADFHDRARPVASTDNGYIRMVAEDELIALATKHDLVCCIKRRPGHFVARGETIALVYPAERLPARLDSTVRGLWVLGETRTPTQDAEFALNQLVEIAVRALSKSINDPFTAVTVLDWLGVCLRKVAGKRPVSPQRLGPDGRLRVVADPVDFGQMMRKAFEPIRHYGCADAMVMSRLLDTISSVAAALTNPSDRDLLMEEAERVRAAAVRALGGDPQLPHVERKADTAQRIIADGHEPTLAPAAAETPDLG